MRELTAAITIGLCVAGGISAADKVSGVDSGKAVFAAKCASCHGKDAKGNPAMAKMFKIDPAGLNLVGLKETDAELSKIILNGKNKMPKFQGKLGDGDVASVLSYVRSLGAVTAKKEAK